MVTDRVGDFIVRLQNAAMAGKERVVVPHSAHLEAIAKKLKELGFVRDIETKERAGKERTGKDLVVTVAYDERGTPKLRGVKRISKPGRRLYVSSAEAHAVKGGTGARLISSPAGIVSDREARAGKVGGENLFEIW